MSLDTSLHIIYGYRSEGNKIQKELDKAYNKGQISDEEYDEIFETLTNNTDGEGLYWCEDGMCGNYDYIGLSLFYKYDDYGEDWFTELDLNQLKEDCNDELLDKLIQEQTWLKDIYDIAGLLDGKLPKLYFVKHVW